MNEKALRILEYPKIIERLKEYAGSVPGRMLCAELTPSDDPDEIETRQQETADALSRLYKKGSISFSGVIDLRPSAARLKVGASLSAGELLSICKVLDVCARVKQWAGGDDREKEVEDCLSQMFRTLEPCPSLSREIRRCLPSEDEVADDASPGLKRVRRAQVEANEKIRSLLNGMVNGSTRTYLQEAVITQRDGRYCLPVKVEYRANVPGMIHDQSATGSTLFIEPMGVVRLNNELKELALQEKKEIEAVLASLSEMAAAESDCLIANVTLLTRLDAIFARAQLAKSYNGYRPDFNANGVVDLRRARHPLLNPRQVVPIDIRIGNDFDQLVISGPNTGGKTVSLKTIGLLTLMGQAGLHIPAAEHSQLSLFTEVYADIGDEQSIEQSLSTFSAHMTNIVSFWNLADEQSLVLFDELGAGTDPEEGAALAISILSNLHRRGIRTIATTHYSELKMYALSTPGVENACCEFDVNSLRPTYKLLIGVPGKSNAFAISRRLGLPDDIIEEAKGHISEEQESFEDVVASLEESRQAAAKERMKTEELRAELEQLRSSLSSKETRLDDSREKILSKARAEAKKILQEAKDYADESIREYNKLSSEKGSSKEMERRRTQLRERLNSVDKGNKGLAAARPKASPKVLRPSDLHLGDSVLVLSLNHKATVTSLPDARGNMSVQMGILHSQVNIKDIALLPDDDSFGPDDEERSSRGKSIYSPERGARSRTSTAGAGKIKVSKSAAVSPEINLIGKTTDEAVLELDKYLDDAYLAHLSEVRIVHGKGTGALRKAVQNFLRKNKHVDSYRNGEYNEGGAGVTIAKLR